MFSDGTFKAAPPPYVQLYTLHGVVRGRRIPLIFALLGAKDQQTYEHLLRMIDSVLRRHYRVRFSPQRIIVDFELGFINAVQARLQTTTVLGCHFHLCKRIYKKVQGLGLAQAYSNEYNVKKVVQLLMALAFVPPNKVMQCYNNLRRNPAVLNIDAGVYQTYPALALLFQYFEATWLRGNFPIELWNVFRRHNNERTTNVCEGWHNRFNRRVGTVHPNVWRFIVKLKKEEMHVRRAIRRSEAGARVPKQRRKYRDLNIRINDGRRLYLARQLPLNLYWRQMRYVCHEF
jgi:hypothetical protein